MKFDLHTHHHRCGHAVGQIRDYIEAAIDADLNMIGISDHSPFFASDQDQLMPGIAMATSDFSNYVHEVLQLKSEYKGRIDVLLGVESDFFEDHWQLYKQSYTRYPFDYLIGSVHFTNGRSIFERGRFEGYNEEQLLHEKNAYYQLIQQSARCRMFDILGHIDALKGFFPRISDVATNEVEKTLKEIAHCGVAIEINTSGKNKDCGGWYPSDDILEQACFHGVKVSFGSDAHVPERVGDEFEQVQHKLKKIGFKEWVYFSERKQRSVAFR